MKLDLAFEQAPVGLAELALDGRFTRTNGRLCAMLGLTCDDLVARDLEALTHPDDAAETRACVRGLLARETLSCALDVRMRRSDGGWLWVQVDLSLVEPAAGAAAHFVGAFSDASDRKEIKQRFSVQYAVSRALAESESAEDAVPRVLMEMAHHLGWRFAAYWTMDETTGKLHAVDNWHVDDADLGKFARVTMATRLAPGTGLPGRTWQSRSPHWSADVVTDLNFPRAAAAGRAGLHGAFAFPICAGETMLGVIEVLGDAVESPNRSLLETAEAIGNQVGQFLARRRLAQAERASQARNTAMIESSLDCVITIDHLGQILEFNPAAERTFGHRRAAVLGQAIADVIVPPRLRDAHRAGLARYLATGEARVLGKRLELPAVRADGSEFPVEITITRVPLPGDPVFTAYLRDVTERKMHEEQLELRTAEADRANRTKSEFLASMSHELRTPLNAVLGYVQLMAEGIRGPVTEAQLADLDRIERSAQHLLGLINDILNFAKLEAGHVRYRIVDVWIDDVLSGVGDLIGPQLRARELRYSYEPGDPAITVEADKDKLVQVMLNLLSNAVKFTEPRGEVRVRWTADATHVHIAVSDTGRGIKAAELETIFEPFVQVGRERGELAHGTGLGLAISRELARAMGGDLSAASTPGSGSTFTFSLPR